MEELSIEQKAQRYDKALERAKGVIEQNPLMEYLKKGIEYILPELKENEDERIRKGIIRNLEYLMDRAEGFVKDELKERIAWLEKQVGQKPIKWSEEDEILLKLSLENLTELKDRFGEYYGRVGNCIDWLKSLKDKYTWKPSDEQMDALHYVTNFDYGGHKATLVSLYEQLKKLMEK